MSTPDPAEVPVKYLSVEEIAERLGTSIWFPRRLIKERRIDYVKLGTGKRAPVRVREDVLEAFINSHTIEAEGAA